MQGKQGSCECSSKFNMISSFVDRVREQCAEHICTCPLKITFEHIIGNKVCFLLLFNYSPVPQMASGWCGVRCEKKKKRNSHVILNCKIHSTTHIYVVSIPTKVVWLLNTEGYGLRIQCWNDWPDWCWHSSIQCRMREGRIIPLMLLKSLHSSISGCWWQQLSGQSSWTRTWYSDQ